VAPTTKLHVEGTITGQVFSDTNTSYYLNPDSSATSLLVAGNVGIGITAPTAKLHIWQNAATDAFRVDDEGTAGDTTPFVIKDTGRVGIGAATPGGKLIVVGEGTTTGITFQTQDSGNNALVTMLDNGNVGIGVTNPSQKLDVVGNIELNQYLYFANGSTEYLRWYTSDFILSDDLLPSAVDGLNLGSEQGLWNSLYLGDGSGLTAGGGLFIGSGQEFLLSYDSDTSLALELSDGTNTFLSVKDQGTTADFAFNVDDLWIGNTGNVGIGTTTPIGRLTIKGAGTTTGITFQTENSSGTALVSMFDNGNVGIGTTAPIAKLHIYDASQNNLFRIANSTTDALFEVTQASMSANIPASFNAAGDTEIAYNLNFSNDTASYVRSLSPLYIEAGDSNSAEDLILRSRGTGDVIIGNSTSYFYNDGSFEVKDGSTSRFLVNATNGNVGIGVASPVSKLHVQTNDIPSAGAIRAYAQGITASGTQSYISGVNADITSDGTSSGTWYVSGKLGWQDDRDTSTTFANTISAVSGSVFNSVPTGFNAFSGLFDGGSSSKAPFVVMNGNVGIGTTAPAYNLHATGSVYLPGISTGTTSGSLCRSSTGILYYNKASNNCLSSTIATKHDINPVSYGLNQILQIQIYTYVYNDDPSSDTRLGFIAEQVESVNPLFASYNYETGKIQGISDYGILAATVQAIKDLNYKIEVIGDSIVNEIRSQIILTKELVVETMATIQGNLSVLGNANVSGTLTAQNITSPTITSIETNLQALTTKVNNLQSAMDAVITQDVNTGKYFMSAEALTTVNLTVQDGANIASINISGNTVSTSLAELKLSALEKVTFFDDRVLVNKDGSIMAKGEIITEKGIKVINEAQETVASIDASGSAYFAEGVTFDKNIASSSAVIAASQTFAEIGENTNSIVTNGEASGQAVLPAGQQELLIRNGKVKTNSLIYISPEGSTSGQVLYLDTKKENEWFKVKVDEPSSADIKFNWWIL